MQLQVNFAKIRPKHQIMRQKMPANVSSVLNTCMDDATYQIQRRNQTDTAKTDAWISQQHITAQQFGDVDVLTCLLQAQKIARTTLVDHAGYMCTYNRGVLNGFLQKMAFCKSRSKLKEQHARAVFRICAQVNRKFGTPPIQ